ncbi:hypothetical protein HDU77_005107 [Chytriomyces hyalinus]|nr:hypothetical protein HDU77_005107 [Chytriomyces hyalinus]
MKNAVAALVLSALLNTCAVAQVVPVRPPPSGPPAPPSGPPAGPPTSTAAITQSAVTTTTAVSDPLPSPGYLLKEYRNGTATASADFDSRFNGGCITRFHLDSEDVPQFENDPALCGKKTDMFTQFVALFKLGKYDRIRGDFHPDGIYEIQVQTNVPTRRDGAQESRKTSWSFTYQGVGAVVSSSLSSEVPPTSTAVVTKSSTQSSAVSTSTMKASESPVPSASAATASASAEPVAPSSQAPAPSNLYQVAGASTTSVLTFAGAAAMALLF